MSCRRNANLLSRRRPTPFVQPPEQQKQQQQQRPFSSSSTAVVDVVTLTQTSNKTVVSSCKSPSLIQTTNTTNLDRQEASLLVDNLFLHTESLMKDVESQIHAPHSHHHHHLIAYSGGVDSSLVAALLHQTALHLASHKADHHSHHVTAVLGLSPAVPHEQVVLAEQVAAHIGVDFHTVSTSEGTDATYIANTGQACLACKTHLYSTLQGIVNHYQHVNDSPSQQPQPQPHHQPQQKQPWSSWQLYNGTNVDDRDDPTRLGLVAAQHFSVVSPIAHLTKAQVRQAARHLGLPNWKYAASPCLRSRLALGVPATPDHLQRIAQAERYVRQAMVQTYQESKNNSTNKVWNETSNLRVRLLANNRACIEVDAEHLHTVSQLLNSSTSTTDHHDDNIITTTTAAAAADADVIITTTTADADWKDYFVNHLGFASVTMREFKSGSVATVTSAPTTSPPQRQSEQPQQQPAPLPPVPQQPLPQPLDPSSPLPRQKIVWRAEEFCSGDVAGDFIVDTLEYNNDRDNNNDNDEEGDDDVLFVQRSFA